MFLLKSLYYTVIISNTLDYLFQYLLQSFYYVFILCATTCTRSVFFADTCTHSVPIFNIASATFEIVDVRDIGRRCLLRFVIGFS